MVIDPVIYGDGQQVLSLQLFFQEKADLFMQLFFQERIESSTDNAPYQFDHVTEIIAVFSP